MRTMIAAVAIATIRRDGHAPPGNVLVDEADLRALVACAANIAYFPCQTCRLGAHCDGPTNMLTHFGLAPEARA